MARRRVNTTKTEIIQAMTRMFLERGYTNTSVRMICDELDMSTGNLTFYFPSKEHMLLELVELLCEFQWDMMEREANEGISSVMAICLEFAAMATMCESNETARDFYISSYTSPLCLAEIRANDARRAREIFSAYRPDWQDEQYAEAEILVSGVEYATLMAAEGAVSLETRISGALHNILGVYGVPPETRNAKIAKLFTMNYREVGERTLTDFKKYVAKANEQALLNLLKRKK